MIPDPEASLAAYHDLRERVTELLGGVDDERSAATQVDACPAWTVTDTAAHLCGVTVDIRGALAEPGGRDARSIVVGLGFMESSLDEFVRSAGLPTLGVRSPQWTAVMGEGEPEVEVEASTFELFRSFGGRRSEAQIRSLAWRGDPGPYLAIFDDGPLTMRAEILIE